MSAADSAPPAAPAAAPPQGAAIEESAPPQGAAIEESAPPQGAARQESGAAADPRAELDVLFPDREVAVRDPDGGGEVMVTVREYRFREGLEAAREARPLLDALAAAAEADPESGPTLDDVDAALAEHADVWLALLSRATGRGPGWLARLSDSDGGALGDALWDLNGDFFIRRFVAMFVRRRAAAERRSAAGSPSPESSTPSSAPDTDADTTTSPGG